MIIVVIVTKMLLKITKIVLSSSYYGMEGYNVHLSSPEQEVIITTTDVIACITNCVHFTSIHFLLCHDIYNNIITIIILCSHVHNYTKTITN